MSHSSHLQVWIRDIDLVLSPIWHAHLHNYRGATCPGDTAAAFIGDGDHFTTVIAAAAVVSAILILYPRWLGQEFPAHQK
jgi:hypothetical protein